MRVLLGALAVGGLCLQLGGLVIHARERQSVRARAERVAPAPDDDALGQLRGRTVAKSETASFAAVKEAVLSADGDAAAAAVRRFNDGVHDGPPLVLYGDDSDRKGIDVRAAYDASMGGSGFEVALVATGPEPARLIVPPGTMVRSSGDYQDTSVVDLAVLDVRPSRGRACTPATICCVEIGKEDPRGGGPVTVATHPKQSVVKVARYAARSRADWTTAQVALWAVANDCTADQVESAPGCYGPAIPAARDLLERAGIDTNALALYRGDAPRPRSSGILETPRLRLGGRG